MISLIVLLTALYTDIGVSEVTPPKGKDLTKVPMTEVECAAVNLYHESRGESDVANAFVMGVVINRKNSPYYPSSVCDVVFQYKQFSWTIDGKSDEIKNIEQYKRLYKIAKISLDNPEYLMVLTEGADHYHANYVMPYWVDDNMKYIATVDNHLFYKFKRR